MKASNRRNIALVVIGLVAIPLVFWLVASCRFTKLPPKVNSGVDEQGNEIRRATSEPRWERIFFAIIDAHTAEARLSNLRAVSLANGDLETRVWVGFGINGEDAIIIRRSSGEWSALHLQGMGERGPFVIRVRNLSPPRSGWESAWQSLTQAGLLVLPDASAAGCNSNMFDGTSYVVEINVNKLYRAYMYDNPKHAQCNEAQRMVRIAEIIAYEFGLGTFSTSPPH